MLGEEIGPHILHGTEIGEWRQAVTRKGAQMTERSCSPKNVPNGRIRKASYANVVEAGVPQQPGEHQLAEVANVNAIKTIRFRLLRFGRNLRAKQGQQTAFVIAEIRDRHNDQAARL